MSRVYKITCLPTQQCYIGSTRTPGLTRYRQHCTKAARGQASGRDSHSQLYAAMREYGPSDFEYRTIEVVGDCSFAELRAREQYWIDHHRANGVLLYNRNSAFADPESRNAKKYLTKLKNLREVCGCGASYCPTNRWSHRQYTPHRRWEQSQLLHLPCDLFDA